MKEKNTNKELWTLYDKAIKEKNLQLAFDILCELNFINRNKGE